MSDGIPSDVIVIVVSAILASAIASIMLSLTVQLAFGAVLISYVTFTFGVKIRDVLVYNGIIPDEFHVRGWTKPDERGAEIGGKGFD